MKLWHFSRFSFIWYISQTFRKFSFFNLCSETFNTAQTIKKTILLAKVHALIVHSFSQNLKIVSALFSRKMKNATSHQTLRFVFILIIFYFWKKQLFNKRHVLFCLRSHGHWTKFEAKQNLKSTLSLSLPSYTPSLCRIPSPSLSFLLFYSLPF
jgi:hypothetical protein